MPEQQYMGLRHYVERAAGELGVADEGPFPPLGLVLRNRALQLLENQITAAQLAADPRQRPDILAHAEALLRSIDLERRAAELMIEHAHEVFGLARPAYLGRPAGAGKEAQMSEPKDQSEPLKPGGTGEGRTPHVAGAPPPHGTGPQAPASPQPLNPGADPTILHPTEGIDPNNPAAGTVDSQTQAGAPPESRAPRNTGLDPPRPAEAATDASADDDEDEPPTRKGMRRR